MTTEDIVNQPLTRVHGEHNGLDTWAVHDGSTAVYLAVTPVGRIGVGVFACTTPAADSDPDDVNDNCPWLGRCTTDAFVTRVAHPIEQLAAASGFDDATIYGLLAELHTSEVTP